ncbi:formate dehydrogenase subunit gamma [Pseudooceanicola sp. MF1-13]|uniref:formate dehydrogenase subunit gamma n=1 Tax=Pseudooceanicola sp. MF1-13 TaxID=3379095 RepID=UPI003892BEB6
MRQTPTDTEIQAIIDSETHREGPMLPILHALQARFDHIPQEALPLIAATLGLTKAEVHGVVTFYHDFRENPAGRHVLKLCRAEACQAMGSKALEAEVLSHFALSGPGTTADGRITIEPVYCLGLCACGPAAMLNGKVIGRVDMPRLTQAIEAAS